MLFIADIDPVERCHLVVHLIGRRIKFRAMKDVTDVWTPGDHIPVEAMCDARMQVQQSAIITFHGRFNKFPFKYPDC